MRRSLRRDSRSRRDQRTPVERLLGDLIETLEPRQLLSDDPIQLDPGGHAAHGAGSPVVLEDAPAATYAGMTGRSDTRVNATAGPNGAITLAFDNLADRPTLLTSSDAGASWEATDILSRVGLTNAQTELVTWTGPTDGRAYAAVVSDFNLYVIQQDANGDWSKVDLTSEAGVTSAESPLLSLTTFIGRDNKVRIAGIDRVGEVVLFTQNQVNGGLAGAGNGWTYTNITDQLADRGIVVPELVGELVPFVTSWGALNMAALDAEGQMQAFWTVPGLGRWNLSNLSEITGAPSFVGSITPFLTSWGGINIAGMTAEGSLEAIWWVPSFGPDWQTVNLSEAFGGPALDPTSVTSFVTPWGGLNVAGIRADSPSDNGELVAYWWAPGLDKWNVTSLASEFGFTDRFASSVEATVSPQGQFNLVGTDSDGSVIRYSWLPGGSWQAENVSSRATPAHESEIVVLESDIDRVLVGADTEIFFSAYVPFATAATRVTFYDDAGEGSGVFELLDNGDSALGDQIAGDGIYAACYTWAPDEAKERVFEAALVSTPTLRVPDTVSSIGAPTQERLDEIMGQNTDFQRKLSEATGGVNELFDLAAEIGDAPGVDSGTVRVSDEGVSWQTVEGILGVALVNEANYQGQRGAAPTDPTGEVPFVTNTTGNDALVLGPYFYQFEPGGGDETDDIAQLLVDDGRGVTAKANASASDTAVTLDDFKSLGGYDIVSIVSHGAAFPEYGVVVDTGVDITEQGIQDNLADLIAGRLAWAGSEDSGTFAITPEFVRRYAGDMSGAVVYIGACKSAFDRSMADAFIAAGADAYIGYTDIVQSSFAVERGIRSFETLLAGSVASDIPGINIDTEAAPDPDPATFVFFGQPDTLLPPPGVTTPSLPFEFEAGAQFFAFGGAIETGSSPDGLLNTAIVGAPLFAALSFNPDARDSDPSEFFGTYADVSLGYVALGDEVLTGTANLTSLQHISRPGDGITNSEYEADFSFNTTIEGQGEVNVSARVLLSVPGDAFTTDALPPLIDLADFADAVRDIEIFIRPIEQFDPIASFTGGVDFFVSPQGSSVAIDIASPTLAYGFSATAGPFDGAPGFLPGFGEGSQVGIGLGLAIVPPVEAGGLYTFDLTETGGAVEFGDNRIESNDFFNTGLLEYSNGDAETGSFLYMEFVFDAFYEGYGSVRMEIAFTFESPTPNLFGPGEFPTTIPVDEFTATSIVQVDVFDGASDEFLASVIANVMFSSSSFG